MKTNLFAHKVANVPATKVQQTISEVISGLFENNTVRVEQHTQNNEVILVMMANGICATLHVQEMAAATKKGRAV